MISRYGTVWYDAVPVYIHRFPYCTVFNRNVPKYCTSVRKCIFRGRVKSMCVPQRHTYDDEHSLTWYKMCSATGSVEYLTQITYIFLKNSSIFRRRWTRISVRTWLDFPHASARKSQGRNFTWIRPKNGKSQSRAYVQSLVMLSQLC